jgi:hypothetical protein
MAVNLSPVAGAAAQFFDNSGQVLTGGKLYTYLAGTTTPAATYTSSSGVTAHPNPIILNAAGRVPDSGEIWLTDGISYKFVLKDQNDVLIATYDNLSGINSNFVNFTGEEETQTATQGQTVFTLTTLNYSPDVNNLLVFVNGSKQISGTNYQETSATVITFVDGLNVGDVVDFTTATPINTETASSIAFTGFKGQNGNVQNLGGNNGADWIGYLPAGVSPTAVSIQDKFRGYDTFLTYPSQNILGYGRNWFDTQVPAVNDFIDNVFSVQNKSTNGTIYGNAAIAFLDRAGTERGAVGYSRNNAIQPAGYYPNTLYCEIGNPFTTDAEATNFAVINTIKAGGPYWGGAAKSYFPIEVNAASGKITLNDGGNDGTIRIFTNIVDLGGIGEETSQLNIAGLNTAVRFREYEFTNSFAITTNVSNMVQGTPVGQDNTGMSSWKMQMGYGNSSTPVYDSFKVGRVAPGGTTWTNLLVIDKDGNTTPGTDNTQTLGSSFLRWSVVYAGTGTINTSDEREKQDIKDLSALEKEVAIGIKGLIKSFRFKDAVANKGDKARIHFGVTAQQVAEAFRIVGLNPDDYAMFCYDEWEATEAVINKEGNEVYPAQPAGNRYGIRYDELLAFVISAL